MYINVEIYCISIPKQAIHSTRFIYKTQCRSSCVSSACFKADNSCSETKASAEAYHYTAFSSSPAHDLSIITAFKA